MASTRSAEKEAFWRMAMEEQRNSGLTIKAFCKQQGISQPSFYAWRRELKQRDTEGHDAGGQASDALVTVSLVDDQKTDADKTLSVDLRIGTPSGFTVDIETASPDGATDRAVGIAVKLESLWRFRGDASC